MKLFQPLLLTFILICTISSVLPSTVRAQGTPLPPDERPYQYVENMPEYFGGNEAFTKLLYDSLSYPEEAITAKKSGVTVVRFIVRPDGTIQDASTLMKLGYGLDQEAIRIVKLSSGNWKPGSQNGKIVHVALDVTIDFRKKAPFEVEVQEPEKPQKKARKKKQSE